MNEAAYEGLTGNRLHDARDNWKSLCPIHIESTPSFFIHKETYLCHCFGCGVRGTVDFILARAYETTPERIRKEIGMPKIAPYLGEGVIKKDEETFSWAKLYSFPRISMHPFLKKRGFSSEIVVLHGARWDKKYARIVFPLQTIGSPKIVGAVGRTIKSLEDETKKWYYYWGTLKSTIVYQPIDTLTLNIICEGVFDTMWLNQHGYPGAAALLGAEASDGQINTIKGSTNEVTLFLDNDEAGRIGARKLANRLKSSVKVTFAKYPEGKKDPQELTKEELDTAIEDRLTYVQYTCN